MFVGLEGFLKQIADGTEEIRDDEYIGEDGLPYCKLCKTKRVFVSDDKQFAVRVPCKHQEEERKKAEEEEKRQRRLQEFNERKESSLLGARYKNLRFDQATITESNRSAYEKCQNYAKHSREAWKNNIGLYIYGDNSSGKTFLTACLCTELLWQGWRCMDVKFVPRECYIGGKATFERYYQYTMIDEATRERFIYPYKEHSGWSTKDFIQRAILYFGYAPKIIQTDNGTEFTNPKGTGEGKVHIADITMQKFGITHQLIRPYTPRHNGKVERSHRTDQERFYDYLQYKTFEELREKMSAWLTRYNNTPSTTLRDRYGKKRMQTPIEKREELLEIYKELKGTEDAPRVRFVKNRIA